MTDRLPVPPESPPLTAMFVEAWRRFGPREVMDDGSEVVSYNTLMRRVMALSCFIDECAEPGRRPVLLYLPSGLWAVRCLLAVMMTGRPALPIEAIAEARRGPGQPDQRRFLEPRRPHLELLEEKPSLMITLAPLARIAEAMLAEASLSGCPVLYANEMPQRMDIGHQEKIRARLQPDWIAAAAALDTSLPALLTETPLPAAGPGEALLTASTHAQVAREVAARLRILGEPAPQRFLSMTAIGKSTYWTHSLLPSLALGGRTSFIRFFHPRHVRDVIHRDRIDHLLMTPSQYAALTTILPEAPPSWPVQYWTDGVPSDDLAAAFETAAAAPLRRIHESHA
jgi:hypothetical protein